MNLNQSNLELPTLVVKAIRPHFEGLIFVQPTVARKDSLTELKIEETALTATLPNGSAFLSPCLKSLSLQLWLKSSGGWSASVKLRSSIITNDRDPTLNALETEVQDGDLLGAWITRSKLHMRIPVFELIDFRIRGAILRLPPHFIDDVRKFLPWFDDLKQFVGELGRERRESDVDQGDPSQAHAPPAPVDTKVVQSQLPNFICHQLALTINGRLHVLKGVRVKLDMAYEELDLCLTWRNLVDLIKGEVKRGLLGVSQRQRGSAGNKFLDAR
jgi:hypothetical protein